MIKRPVWIRESRHQGCFPNTRVTQHYDFIQRRLATSRSSVRHDSSFSGCMQYISSDACRAVETKSEQCPPAASKSSLDLTTSNQTRVSRRMLQVSLIESADDRKKNSTQQQYTSSVILDRRPKAHRARGRHFLFQVVLLERAGCNRQHGRPWILRGNNALSLACRSDVVKTG